MKRIAMLVLSVIAFLALSGCMYVDTLIKVKKDGSGTIEQEVLMSKAFNEQMKQMAAAFGGGADTEQSSPVPDKAELEKSAASMGKGVKFVSVKEVKNKKYEGFRAVYSFKDVRGLSVNQNPSDNVSAPGMEAEESPRENLSFKFSRKGKTAVLTINMPKDAEDKDGGEGGKQEDNAEGSGEMDPQMKQMMADLYMRMSVEVDGRIVKTNATNREGSRVVLFEMDFNKLIKDEKKFKEFSSRQPETIEETKEMMQNMPGIKVELEKSVKVEFK